MKKYFSLPGFLAVRNLNRVISKFIVLFLIIPSLIIPQFAMAATADVDHMRANPMRAVASPGITHLDELYNDATGEDDTPVQPSCWQRWSLRISRWVYGAPQTPFTPAPSAIVEMAGTPAASLSPVVEKKRSSVYRVFNPDEVGSKDVAPHGLTTAEALALGAFRAKESMGDGRTSFAPKHNTNTVMNPLAVAKHARGVTAAGTGARIIREADRASPPSDPESTATGSSGSDSPPETGIAKNPLHVVALHDEAWSEEDVERGESVARALEPTFADLDGAAHIRSVYERLTSLLEEYVRKAKAGTASTTDQDVIRHLMQGYNSKTNVWNPNETYPALRKALEAYNVYIAKSKPKVAKGIMPSEDPDEKLCKALLDELEELDARKALNIIMLQEFNPSLTRRNLAMYSATFILTGFLCMELWGEGKMVIDRTFTALLAESTSMVKYLLEDPDGQIMKRNVSTAIIANCAIASGPYLIYRLNKFVDYLAPVFTQTSKWIKSKVPNIVANGFDNISKRIKSMIPTAISSFFSGTWERIDSYLPTKTSISTVDSATAYQMLTKRIPMPVQLIGQVLVVIGAVTNGAMPAYVSYETNRFLGNQQVYAQTIPPFLFVFYTIDSFLRLDELKTKIFTKLFVSRGDPVAKDRAELLQFFKDVKQNIKDKEKSAYLKFEDSMARLRHQAASAATAIGDEGIRLFKAIANLAEMKPETKKKSSWTYYTRKYGPLGAGLILCLANSYLVGRLSYFNFGSTLQFLSTGESTSSLVDQLIMNQAIVEAEHQTRSHQIQYDLWPRETENITNIYDGNRTDWCWDCFNPANYILGDQSDPISVLISLLRCPGVSPDAMLYCNPATDLAYTQNNCEGSFWYFGAYSSDYDPTGQTYLRGYLAANYPELDPSLNITRLSLTDTQVGVSYFGAGAAAFAAYGVGVLAMVKAVRRIISSYQKHPDEEVLPGRRSCTGTTAIIVPALFESLVRASPVLINGWINMMNDNINNEFMWTVLATATLTSALPYFMDFDETYAWVSTIISRVRISMAEKMSSFIGRPYTPDRIEIQKDTTMRAIEQLERLVPQANAGVIRVLKKV